MQETKLSDDAFPALTFAAMGYDSVHHGQGQWNGVAILSKVGLDEVVQNFADGDADLEARVVSARCGGLRVSSVYVPNGRALEHEQYQYKLSWLAQLRRHLAAVGSPDEAMVVAGDFNIAPVDIDVYEPAKFVGSTHTSEAERARLTELYEWGMVDLFRQHHTEPKLYSWWDYRAGDFHQGRGLRIDLVLGTKSVADRCTWSVIDRNARKGQSPSDHAPVIVELD